MRYLIDAMVTVRTAVPEAKLLIVGHGELEQTLKKQVEQLGLGDVVLFSGGIPNAQLPPYYATADIFIGPSIQVKGGDTEGFGLTFVEAAMSGCLVIGTRVGGIEDIVKDGETGFLVPPRNSFALAAAIVEVIAMLNVQDDNRLISRQILVEKFGWKLIVQRYIYAYSGTL